MKLFLFFVAVCMVIYGAIGVSAQVRTSSAVVERQGDLIVVTDVVFKGTESKLIARRTFLQNQIKPLQAEINQINSWLNE